MERSAMLCAFSLFVAAVAASEAAARDGLLAVLDRSRARCVHGDAGVVISVHSAVSPSTYRANLEKAFPHQHHRDANRFHREYTHINAIVMTAIHPETLAHVAKHEHTTDLEASCIIQHTLPTPVNESATASLFVGRYRQIPPPPPPTPPSKDGKEPPRREPPPASRCEHRIDVAHPYWTRSSATLTIHTPSLGMSDCSEDGAGDVMTTYPAWVHMVRPHAGNITVPIFMGASLEGSYRVDANGRLQDRINWSNGWEWDSVPGAPYNRDSSIGPFDDGTVRTRNPQALVRWNWGLDRIDSTSTSLDNTYVHGNATGAGTTLYNLDTGVMVDHDDFRGRAVGGWSAGCPTGTEKECRGAWAYRGIITAEVMGRTAGGCSPHGTHTASTAAGSLYGVASAAKVVAVQVLSCEGSAADHMLIDGMTWAVNDAEAHQPRRPSVISMSLGGQTRSRAIDAMVRKVNAHGLMVVVAAGNDGGDACLNSPAGESAALTIGASGMEESNLPSGALATDDTKPTFSCDGSCVDLYAPGVEILAGIPALVAGPVPGLMRLSTHMTSIMSGTSMATPMAAGVALQIWGLFPRFRPDDVRRAMLCLGVPGSINNLETHTRNLMLQGGSQIGRSTLRPLIVEQRENTGPRMQSTRDATHCFGEAGRPDVRVGEPYSSPPVRRLRLQRQGLLEPDTEP